MGQLMAKLMGIFGKQEHKVIIVGLDNAGKSTILYQFLMNEAVHTCPTIGSNVEEVVLRKTHFLMWDIGGQEALRSTWNTYFSNTEFIVLVIDSTDRDRLLTTREELYKMLAHEALRDASVLIFANKQDLKDSMTTVEISQFLTLSAIKDHPWHIQGCCALTGEGWNHRGQGPRWLIKEGEALVRSAKNHTFPVVSCYLLGQEDPLAAPPPQRQFNSTSIS
ncbi:putative ADP-ribosylation factor-like protein 5C isoform X1 [Myotis daubentonii]|uniref:putative ADP-ribosylation factor-like protein 5C isoform X1 n=2 Tax=Myotis daubentonii TaxID=98922 RepID=UPI0028732DAA|nr:putative ADP-ribosylation factor-like protein 5C isoform X1 [Myotis daubentonii]